MGGIGIGVQQRNRDSLGSKMLDAIQQCRQLRFIQGYFSATICAQTLLHPKPAVARDQSWERFLRQPVDIAPDMAVDFKHILKACCGQQNAAGELSFQHRIGGDGGAVQQKPDIGQSEAEAFCGFLDAGQKAD